jgi:hypothetical protein
MIISRWRLLRIRNVSEKVVKKIKTQILYPTTIAQKSCRLWDNVEKCGRSRQATDYNIARCMRFTCCISKATDTHSGYILLTAFPQQQWLRERASMLRYTYIAWLVEYYRMDFTKSLHVITVQYMVLFVACCIFHLRVLICIDHPLGGHYEQKHRLDCTKIKNRLKLIRVS